MHFGRFSSLQKCSGDKIDICLPDVKECTDTSVFLSQFPVECLKTVEILFVTVDIDVNFTDYNIHLDLPTCEHSFLHQKIRNWANNQYNSFFNPSG